MRVHNIFINIYRILSNKICIQYICQKLNNGKKEETTAHTSRVHWCFFFYYYFYMYKYFFALGTFVMTLSYMLIIQSLKVAGTVCTWHIFIRHPRVDLHVLSTWVYPVLATALHVAGTNFVYFLCYRYVCPST